MNSLALRGGIACLLTGLAGCGPSPASSSASSSEAGGTLRFATPQALSACAEPPADLQARLWISGTSAPCSLDVDVAGGTTSGGCEVIPGIERRFTLDWFVDVGVDGGREIVLAQAQKDVDLAGVNDDEITLAIEDDDIDTADCLDMSADQFNGAASVDVDGVARPVCDLDADGDDNLAELCAGGDPLGGAG